MNTTKILASTVIALASAMAGNAFAQAPDHVYPAARATSGALTRAQVQSELAQAQRNGTASSQANDHGYASVAVVKGGTGKSRAEVQAELRTTRNGSSVPYDHS